MGKLILIFQGFFKMGKLKVSHNATTKSLQNFNEFMKIFFIVVTLPPSRVE